MTAATWMLLGFLVCADRALVWLERRAQKTGSRRWLFGTYLLAIVPAIVPLFLYMNSIGLERTLPNVLIAVGAFIWFLVRHTAWTRRAR